MHCVYFYSSWFSIFLQHCSSNYDTVPQKWMVWTWESFRVYVCARSHQIAEDCITHTESTGHKIIRRPTSLSCWKHPNITAGQNPDGTWTLCVIKDPQQLPGQLHRIQSSYWWVLDTFSDQNSLHCLSWSISWMLVRCVFMSQASSACLLQVFHEWLSARVTMAAPTVFYATAAASEPTKNTSLIT